MKKLVNDSAHRFWLSLPVLIAFLILAGGCVTRLGRNPLEGWKGGQTASEGIPFSAAITDDYHKYIQSLPADERSRVDEFNIRFYESTSDERAVEITIPINRIRWKHVLFYDRSQKRVKTIKYAASRYLS